MGKRSLCIMVLLVLMVGSIAVPSVNSFETTDTNGFPYPGDDWAWEMIGTPYAHQIGQYGDDVLVAVMDTGIDYDHPDLKDRMWDGIGYDFVNGNDDPMDNDGHGTHVAGIVASVAPGAKLMALKVMEEEGGRWVEVAQAIKFARDNGADIITMSFGGEQSPMARVIQIQINFAYQEGVLMVAAAGNDDTDTKLYPAANEQVIAVSAVDDNMDKASYSNYGDWIELAAPGGDSGASIISTIPGDSYGYKIGTSMACPFVTGAAAIMMGAYPGMTNVEVREALREQALDLGEPGRDPVYGYGLVNAYRAAGGNVPTPPRDLTAKGRDGMVELSWTVPWDEGVAPVEGYRVYRGTSVDDMELMIELNGTSYTDEDVVNEQRYHYHITAYSSEGESIPSDTVAVTPRENIVPPSEPRDLNTSLTEDGVKITWNAPMDDGGDEVSEYNIYRDEEPITSIIEREYIDRDVQNGSSYSYAVTAVNYAGESELSEVSTITVPEGQLSDDENDGEQPPADEDPLPTIPSAEDHGYLLLFLLILAIALAGAGLVYYVIKDREDE